MRKEERDRDEEIGKRLMKREERASDENRGERKEIDEETRERLMSMRD